MKNQTNPITDQELFDKAKQVLDVCHKKIVNVLLNRKTIVNKLFGDWTDEEKSFINPKVMNPQSFRDALTLCWLNGDVDRDFHTAVIELLDRGVFCERELNEAYEFLYGYC